ATRLNTPFLSSIVFAARVQIPPRMLRAVVLLRLEWLQPRNQQQALVALEAADPPMTTTFLLREYLGSFMNILKIYLVKHNRSGHEHACFFPIAFPREREGKYC
ncbi:MAG: hypothetical protein IJC51_03370, partial [Eggerthellaceae bacterium]|nr:hypothetical protein [Eggerthellaceae bacterium]